MINIKLTERGPSEIIPLSEWRLANLEEPMRILENKRILRLLRTSSGVVVTPSNYVGEMTLPSAVVTIAPKAPKMVAAMENLALRGPSKFGKHFEAEKTYEDGNEADSAAIFVENLLRCIHDGFPWNYSTTTSITSFPRGRLEFGATVKKLAARGINHRVAVTVPTHEQQPDLVRVVRAALDVLPNVPGARPRTLSEAEILSAALDTAEAFTSVQDAVDAAIAILQRIDHEIFPAAASLAQSSVAILTNESLRGSWVKHVPGGMARFRSLEDLWERCSQHLVAAWLKNEGFECQANIHKLRGSGIRLYEDGGPKIDPDIVVENDSKIAAVIDAKYKVLELGTTSSAADYYQMTCYLRRLGAYAGILMHINETQEYLTQIGTTADGAPVLTAVISDELLLEFGENTLSTLLRRSPLGKSFHKSFADSLGQERGNGIADLSRDILLRV